MARYLMTIRSTAPVDASRDLAPPAGYLVEWAEAAAGAGDGLERWEVELQVAGAVAAWAQGAAFDEFWDYLDGALAALEVRPRGTVSIRGHTDPKRIGISFGYLGKGELKRARESLQKRIEGALDKGTKKLKADVEIAL